MFVYAPLTFHWFIECVCCLVHVLSGLRTVMKRQVSLFLSSCRGAIEHQSRERRRAICFYSSDYSSSFL